MKHIAQSSSENLYQLNFISMQKAIKHSKEIFLSNLILKVVLIFQEIFHKLSMIGKVIMFKTKNYIYIRIYQNWLCG